MTKQAKQNKTETRFGAPTPSAVLVCLVDDGKSQNVILTRRALDLTHHAGQIALPGGTAIAEDANLQSTALRETCEEINILPQSVIIVGRLPKHQTTTGFDITPFVAHITQLPAPLVNQSEVAEVFTVPVLHILQPQHYHHHTYVLNGRKRDYYSLAFGHYYIWGATARILLSLAQNWQAKWAIEPAKTDRI